MKNHIISYRAEIDGLRALAVIPVILFHSGISVFSGGYVGVDIFFVISGYLITSIILSQIEKKEFSITNFYEKRARRILPALIFVSSACIPFAFLTMTPEMFKDFGKSLSSVQIFVSNFYFWSEINYFSPSVELNPLIHSWSLSVEEQFYLLFPIFMIVFYRFGIKRITFILFLISVISILFSQFSGNLKFDYPYINDQFKFYSPSTFSSFYLPFARAWELLAGCIIAIYLNRNNYIFKSSFDDILCIIGIILILISIFYYSSETPFPSFYTILPVLGTSLLIIFMRGESQIKKLFSNFILVNIGLVSFSAYLWHQPIFAFTKLKFGDDQHLIFLFILIIISFLLAYLTWRFIEVPFRNQRTVKRRTIFITLPLATVILFTVGLGINLNDGFAERFSNKERILLDPPKTTETCRLAPVDESIYKDIYSCEFGQEINPVKNIVVYGDSHMKVLYGQLNKYFIENGIKGIYLENQNCKRFFTNQCKNSSKLMINFIKEQKAENIILNFRWAMRIFDGSNLSTSDLWEDFYEYDKNELSINQINKKGYLINFLNMFQEFNDDLIVIYPTPEFIDPKIHNMERLNNKLEIDDIYYPQNDFYKKNRFLFDTMNTIIKPVNRLFVDKLFCNTFIEGMCVSQHELIPYYADTNHLSEYGSKLLIDNLSRLIK